YAAPSLCSSALVDVLSTLSSPFFFNDPPPPQISPLSLHDALPISCPRRTKGPDVSAPSAMPPAPRRAPRPRAAPPRRRAPRASRSEEHTSELQSLTNLVCRLLLEKKNNNNSSRPPRAVDAPTSGYA